MASRRPGSRVPTLRHERALLREGRARLAAVDEVGRGALGGPVTVGVVLVDLSLGTAPVGLRDSKLLTPEARERLAPKVARWARLGHAVAHAGPEEIDRFGILGALRLAGERALAALPEQPDLVLLDGSYDWLTRPRGAHPTLWDDLDALPRPLPVRTMVKADLRCAGVAAASVLAKVTRDRLMVELAGEHPQYGWEVNRGYATPEHLAAIAAHGPCAQHRRSWNLRTGEQPDHAGEAGAGREAVADEVLGCRPGPETAELPLPAQHQVVDVTGGVEAERPRQVAATGGSRR